MGTRADHHGPVELGGVVAAAISTANTDGAGEVVLGVCLLLLLLLLDKLEGIVDVESVLMLVLSHLPVLPGIIDVLSRGAG